MVSMHPEDLWCWKGDLRDDDEWPESRRLPLVLLIAADEPSDLREYRDLDDLLRWTLM